MRPSIQIIRAVAEIEASAAPIDLRDPSIFRANLAFFYQVILASEQLLEECAQLVSGELREYLLKHLREEKGHAQWLREDIGTTDFPLSQTAIAMAGTQYYLMKHISPRCLLGYMLVLECFPMEPDVLCELERIHGAKLVRTLRHHAENDPDHGAELLLMIDKFYGPEIMASAIETARYIKQFSMELQ